MNRKANPKLIGAFITLTGAIFVMLIMYFGSDKLFKAGTRYLMFFDQSVNGLDEGSSVKYRGVPIGTVERILIHIDGQKDESRAIPIIISIDHDRMVRQFVDPNANIEPVSFRDLIARGLIARLNLESLITGQLFVELGYVDVESLDYRSHMSGETELVEIPTVGSSLHQITEDAAEVIAKITELDFQGIVTNINEVLIDLEMQIENLNTAGVSEAVVESAQGINDFLESDELATILRELGESLVVVQRTAETYNMESGALGEKVDELLVSVSDSLEGFDALVEQTSDIIEPGSSMRSEMSLALRELRRTAQSIRLLTDYIERNPNAFLTGRAQGE
ncbi:MAG: MlaD family protein [Coraliomargarita sp.]